MSFLSVSRFSPLIAMLSLLFVSTPAFAADAPLEWKAGVSTATITPRQPMWMSGYASRKKPSEGVAQDLFAKALALEDAGGARLVIITLDLIGVRESLRKSVEQQVLEKHKLPPAALLLNASHTHCGPEYRETAGREEEARAYHAFLEETLVRITGEALANLAPAKLSHGRARAGFAMNRRLPTPKGYVNSPYPDGPVDHEVPVLRVDDASGAMKALLFGYACHNTTLGFFEFCGDYAGYAQEYLQADNPGVTALFLTGCGADQNPYPRGTLDLAKRHGRTLATSVEAALMANPKPVRGPLRAIMETVSLERAGGQAEFPYPVQVIQFGEDLTLVALASEVVVDFSLRLKKELAGPSVWMSSYCNGYFSYIPSRRVLEEGGYEAGGPWTPTVEERIVGKVHELNRRLKEPGKAK